jgi:hypothetical protein
MGRGFRAFMVGNPADHGHAHCIPPPRQRRSHLNLKRNGRLRRKSLSAAIVIALIVLLSGQCHAAGMREDAIKKECTKLPEDYSKQDYLKRDWCRRCAMCDARRRASRQETEPRQ